MPLGISLIWQSPLFSANVISGTLTKQIDSYSHTLGLQWEYLNAEIGMALPRNELEEWYYAGLGRDIKIYDAGGTVIFRGFVNSINASIGGINVTIGPLTDIGNRVLATYTARLILGNFIADAGQTETVFAEDAASQGQHGIWEKIIQAGNCFVNPDTGYNEAEYARDAYLLQYKNPQTTLTLTPNASEAGRISLSVVGYQEWFNAYYFQNREFTAAPVSQTVTQKITAALAANPNTGVLSVSTAKIGTNPALKLDNENQYRTAFSIIEDATKVGDGTNLWRSYVNENLELVFETVSLDIFYSYHLLDNRQVVFDYITNNALYPTSVKAGKVIFLSDWLMGEYGFPGTVGIDPRVALINQVRYTAPNNLDISTVPLNRFESYINFKAGGSY